MNTGGLGLGCWGEEESFSVYIEWGGGLWWGNNKMQQLLLLYEEEEDGDELSVLHCTALVNSIVISVVVVVLRDDACTRWWSNVLTTTNGRRRVMQSGKGITDKQNEHDDHHFLHLSFLVFKSRFAAVYNFILLVLNWLCDAVYSLQLVVRKKKKERAKKECGWYWKSGSSSNWQLGTTNVRHRLTLLLARRCDEKGGLYTLHGGGRGTSGRAGALYGAGQDDCAH